MSETDNVNMNTIKELWNDYSIKILHNNVTEQNRLCFYAGAFAASFLYQKVDYAMSQEIFNDSSESIKNATKTKHED